ncbi:MAG: type II toxin-antitoxin system VapC family toxin [Chthoniobacterales bacterium]|nr:type II toxin-antitoxin system VapC family toxin [Chthoniobacterales bacterium]
MNFWDTSALVPLIVTEASSDLRRKQYAADPWAVVWFGTLAEIESSLVRRQRDGQLPADVEHAARKRLHEMTKQWTEVTPTTEVRARAIRLLRVHPLRAADAFQLAAALIFCREQPQHLPLLTADQRLRDAANLEGFPVE